MKSINLCVWMFVAMTVTSSLAYADGTYVSGNIGAFLLDDVHASTSPDDRWVNTFDTGVSTGAVIGRRFGKTRLLIILWRIIISHQNAIP